MTSEYKKITIPIELKTGSQNAEGDLDPRCDKNFAAAFDEKVRPEIAKAKAEGWYPVGRTGLNALWSAGLLTCHNVKGFMSQNLVCDSVTIYLQGPDDHRITCPECGKLASRFDVHCSCGYYLPLRPEDPGLEERLREHMEAYEAAQAAAAAAAEPTEGQRIALAIGAGLLGLAGGIAGGLGKSIQQDVNYGRLEDTIAAGVRRAK